MRPWTTRSQLVRDLSALGVAGGDVLMLHASVRAVGWIVGGPDVVLRALLDRLGPRGTLMMYVGWADGTYEMDSWPDDLRQAYLDECPPFDPATSRAVKEWGVLAEFLRTWPGSKRSANPEASMAAVGDRADWLTRDHPLNDAFGPRSPLARLVEARGKVLLLGSPIGDVTLLHHAESLARIPNKRTVRYRQPILRDGRRVWVEVEDLDSIWGIVPWPFGHYFDAIMDLYLTTGQARIGQVGQATSILLDAANLLAFAVDWMERNLAASPSEGSPTG